MNIVKTVKSWFGNEGGYRGPALAWSEQGNAFSVPFGDGYQSGLTLDGRRGAEHNPIVHACVRLIAGSVSQCLPKHFREDEKGNIIEVKDSPAALIFRTPNRFQTYNQWITSIVTHLKYAGEVFVYIKRDERYNPVEFIIFERGTCSPYFHPDGELFYSVGKDVTTAEGIDSLIPERNIMHIRQNTELAHNLIGVSDIQASAYALGIHATLSKSQLAFYNNASRPSGVLETEKVLNREQMTTLRAAFQEQSKDWSAGKVPILTAGLQWKAAGLTTADAQTIAAHKFSGELIATSFGVPHSLIGLKDSSYNNAEHQSNAFLSLSLGALLQNIEESLMKAFDMPMNEYVQMDVKGLLRNSHTDRIQSLTRGITGGVYSINEARAMENLSPIPGQDVPMVQAQMIPVTVLDSMRQTEADRASTAEDLKSLSEYISGFDEYDLVLDDGIKESFAS